MKLSDNDPPISCHKLHATWSNLENLKSYFSWGRSRALETRILNVLYTRVTHLGTRANWKVKITFVIYVHVFGYSFTGEISACVHSQYIGTDRDPR